MANPFTNVTTIYKDKQKVHLIKETNDIVFGKHTLTITYLDDTSQAKGFKVSRTQNNKYDNSITACELSNDDYIYNGDVLSVTIRPKYQSSYKYSVQEGNINNVSSDVGIVFSLSTTEPIFSTLE